MIKVIMRLLAQLGPQDQSQYLAESSDLDRAFSIKTLWRGEVPSLRHPEWHVLRISASQHRKLCQRLKDEDTRLLLFFESDIRADYDPDDGILTRFRGTASPQFVLEVGYGQKALALEQLARDYFEKGPDIKTVLTFKIPYKDPKERP
ncbi:hypothetical protein UCDDA912_g10711 [Diaporthe ampelina]|uniref:Uncharacterized protein n=1 Tax=Diaporthe ampelina TaxID=1214573 RepID=A0A0G2F3N9_9PEZI|nr:hypothetical protein UCDDA912_g10711 [Diaporthe ampelina]